MFHWPRRQSCLDQIRACAIYATPHQAGARTEKTQRAKGVFNRARNKSGTAYLTTERRKQLLKTH
eukprot:5427112-Pyramimonas_sp.AAC.1